MKTTKFLFALLLTFGTITISCDTDDSDRGPGMSDDDGGTDDMGGGEEDPLSLLFTTQTEEDQIGQFASNAMVEYDGSVWVVGGHVGFGPPYFTTTSQVWRSENGANWLSVSTNQFPARTGHTLNVIDGKMIMIGGINLDAGEDYGDIWSSTDGLTWTLESASAIFGNVYHHTVTAFNGRWYLTFGSNVYSSNNGIDWVFEATTGFAAANYQKTVILNDTLYVLGGHTSSTIPVNEVWKTTDGTTWEEVTLAGDIFNPRINHTLTAYEDKAFLIGGRAGTTIFRDIYYSEDMENWTQVELEEDEDGTSDGLYAHNVLNYRGALWIFGGYNSTQASSEILSITIE
ncbi:hypothetical protein EAX61_13070 [Dokdonia sinensis]|uniref:Galactose oxidase n=1 Tax=Dokdonia sinensis TaxID=2479847 RepID=A0A3M0G3F4_9FLAO|nr:hypothetical protein [Dokdonia sinensis]RMB56732.1 hypothetical protein EAX61_13070 [Dokdonia sinensis]